MRARANTTCRHVYTLQLHVLLLAVVFYIITMAVLHGCRHCNQPEAPRLYSQL
ncbi:hypothetical protein COCMIDRAFT_81950 [Bipolaris oryzae ATCC 44560]|uniref:Uncharacterized protein n=1 Tax=Bipolaris oryzae ATCC 44560 TaxID=930090 RepID=W7A344_COCMI|nr:uncharacterized protein COCMIDRAFT_81950 [Bipolaris oryzae ATCC 44560]EUC50451.1 hypothetical protein COCMIDRAFT_81950 [Bipolaris oryzae ATCC 44560]